MVELHHGEQDIGLEQVPPPGCILIHTTLEGREVVYSVMIMFQAMKTQCMPRLENDMYIPIK